MLRLLIIDHLHILEYERVVTDPQSLAAGGSHVSENDFPCSDKGKLFHKWIVGQIWIKIFKNGRTLIVLRMIRVIDMKIFDDYPFRHKTGIAEIMLPGIGSADQAGTGGSAACWHENAIADDEFSLPRTAVVGAQIDEGSSVDGGILQGKGPAADGVYSLVPQGRVADGGTGNSHVGIEPGKGAIV